jgi:hypothetical protein
MTYETPNGLIFEGRRGEADSRRYGYCVAYIR